MVVSALLSADGLLGEGQQTGLYLLIANASSQNLLLACVDCWVCLFCCFFFTGGHPGSGPLQWDSTRLLGQFSSEKLINLAELTFPAKIPPHISLK